MNVRLTILLAVLLIVIGGLVGITQILRTGDNPDRGERLYRLNHQDLVGVNISLDEENIVFVRDSDEWFIKDETSGANVPVEENRWSGVPVLLGGPKVTENLTQIGEELEDLAVYGLDPPRGKIELIPAEGQPIEIQLGDLIPTENGYYAKIADFNVLYIMHNAWVDVMARLVTEPPVPLEGPEAPPEALVEEPDIPR